MSNDGGLNYTKVDYPNNRIVDSPSPILIGRPSGEGDYSVVVKGNYYYLFFSNVDSDCIFFILYIFFFHFLCFCVFVYYLFYFFDKVKLLEWLELPEQVEPYQDPSLNIWMEIGIHQVKILDFT